MTVAAVLIFCLTYVLIASRRLRLLPLGRPAGALLGAVMMVACGVLTPRQTFAAIDHDTILLLFSMMLLTASFESAGFFEALAYWLLRLCRSPGTLLVAVSLSAAVPGSL